jgi:hypothetical protein
MLLVCKNILMQNVTSLDVQGCQIKCHCVSCLKQIFCQLGVHNLFRKKNRINIFENNMSSRIKCLAKICLWVANNQMLKTTGLEVNCTDLIWQIHLGRSCKKSSENGIDSAFLNKSPWCKKCFS